MKKGMKILAAVLAVSLMIPFTGCTRGELKDKNKLIMATNAEFQPFEYMDNGKIVGIDVDMATQIAKDMNVKLEIQNMNFDSVVAAVASGKADVGIAGISKDPTREKSVDFSDPYYDASQMIIVKKDNTTINSQDTLKNKKIAVQKGTTGDEVASKLTSDANMVRFDATTDAVTELKNGKVDAVVLDSFPAKIFVKQNSSTLKIVGKPLTSESYCIAIRKGNKALLNKVNQSLKTMKANGTIDKLVNQYS